MTSIQVANLQFGSASQFRQYIFYVSYTNYKKSSLCDAVPFLEL